MNSRIPRDLRLKLIASARSMRREPTHAERLLWEKLRNRQLDGFKFRRQHVIHSFIVDFYCPQARLVVEVDGGIHKAQTDYDQERSELLRILGYRMLRFRNEEVEVNPDRVAAEIAAYCANES